MSNPFIIGITGSYGKTSCAYTLHEYFKYLGYSSCLMSSTRLEMPDINNSSWYNELKTPESLDYYLYQAKGCDFLIIEVHEESLKNNIYKNVTFDCKVLVNFKNNYNQHRSKEQYLKLKTDFFNEEDCIKIINKDIDNYNLFNTEQSIVFSTKEQDLCDIYPVSKKLKFKNSNCQLIVGSEKIKINSYLNNGGYNNLIAVIATLYALDMFDNDSFVQDFFVQNPVTKGRYEVHEYGGKNVIIDSGNTRSLIEFMKETEDINNYNVKSLISIAGGLSDDLYDSMVAKGFISLNKYVVADPVVRKHCLTFGGNLYKACHKLAVFRDDDAFNEVVNEVGSEAFLDLSNNTLFLPKNIVEEMIDICIMLGTDDLTRNPKYCKNFWWRSIPTIKGYFTINYDKFIQVYNALKSLDNNTLSESCDYVKEMIDYTISQYRQFGDAMKNIDVKKIYLTMSDSNQWSNRLELEMYKAFFEQDVEIYEDRQEALKSIVESSEDNDILYIAGRGDKSLYKEINGNRDKFTDSEYIDKLFNKGGTYEFN